MLRSSLLLDEQAGVDQEGQALFTGPTLRRRSPSSRAKSSSSCGAEAISFRYRSAEIRRARGGAITASVAPLRVISILFSPRAPGSRGRRSSAPRPSPRVPKVSEIISLGRRRRDVTETGRGRRCRRTGGSRGDASRRRELRRHVGGSRVEQRRIRAVPRVLQLPPRAHWSPHAGTCPGERSSTVPAR